MSGQAERETFGIFYGWWRGDPLPPLDPAPGVTTARIGTTEPAPAADGLDADEVATLRQQGHRLYVARIDGAVAGWGWVATQTASIGELGVEMHLTSGERYLWGFETIPAWRGRGVYTTLLRAILHDDHDADRIWIGHNAGNDPSAKGILAAGFTPVGEAYRGADGTLRYARYGDDERAKAAEALLGMPT